MTPILRWTIWDTLDEFGGLDLQKWAESTMQTLASLAQQYKEQENFIGTTESSPDGRGEDSCLWLVSRTSQQGGNCSGSAILCLPERFG